jgi:hypothetical protein
VSEKIFLIRDDGVLQPMVGRPYEKELDLQDLLARYCDLLPGEQIDESSPRKPVMLLRITSNGDLSYGLGTLTKYTSAFEAPAARDELLRRINAVPGTAFPPKEKQTDSSRPLTHLSDPAAMLQFKSTMDWIIEKLTTVQKG